MEKQIDGPVFKQVGKGLFEEMYFRLGGEKSGWTADYWRQVIEPAAGLGWRFLVEEPRSPEHNRMWVVTDHKALEHRLFFTTEQDEDHFMEWPGEV
ncbi:MAG TPA: hypothetical protein VGX48_25195 [Pyrinomonadaceae bacterium]|nr:hypothetical protein [Pyrinomonadaceae bacterium]